MQSSIKPTTINIRTDTETKNSFGELCNELGLSVSSVLNMIMRSSVRNKEIPVNLSTVHRPVSLDDFTDQELLDMVEKGRQQVRKGNFYTDDKFTKKLNTLYKRYGL